MLTEMNWRCWKSFISTHEMYFNSTILANRKQITLINVDLRFSQRGYFLRRVLVTAARDNVNCLSEKVALFDFS